MTTPPLTINLYIPSVWPGFVSRPRPIERLDVSGNASACSLGCLGASLIKVLPEIFNRCMLYSSYL